MLWRPGVITGPFYLLNFNFNFIIMNAKTFFVLMVILLAILILASCTTDTTNPNPSLQVGHRYRLKSNKYNTGAFQPTSPLLVKSLYVKYDGGYWADCYARVNWNAFNVSGTAQTTKIGNDSLMNHYSHAVGDTTTVVWNVPQGDLGNEVN